MKQGIAAGARREKTIEWLASRVMPHEREARARLRRLGSQPQEIDDIVQDAYLQIALLDSVDHIHDGRAYLLGTVRNIMLQRVRRERIVRIGQLLDSDALALADDAPDPERRVQARHELDRVFKAIAELPPRCRQIVEMRRIEGLSLSVIAARLGITEKAAEHETYRGLRLLLASVGETEADQPGAPQRNRFGRLRIGRRRTS